MAKVKNELGITNKERAALTLQALGIIDNWRECYTIAADRKREELDGRKGVNVYASKWKNSPKIARAYGLIQREIADDRAAARAEGYKKAVEEMRKQAAEEQRKCRESNDEEEKKRAVLVDYSDPNNRKRLYNEVIRDARSDPKTRLDAAKVFEQIQRDDKQAAREQKQVRAYLPLNCSDCPLYQKAREKR